LRNIDIIRARTGRWRALYRRVRAWWWSEQSALLQLAVLAALVIGIAAWTVFSRGL
jgi:hypothetical protein